LVRPGRWPLGGARDGRGGAGGAVAGADLPRGGRRTFREAAVGPSARRPSGAVPRTLVLVLVALVRAVDAQPDLHVPVEDAGVEGGLGRGGGAADVPAVRQAEDTAVPGAADAPVGDGALGQRARLVTAPFGQGVERPAGLAHHQDRHVVDGAPHGPAGGELVHGAD